eukprot:gene7980-8178_t
MAAVDAVAQVDDVPTANDVRDVIKGMSKLDIKADQSVSELTPQAKLMARVAAQAERTIQGDWDVPPHPLLEKGTPTRQQFDDPDTTPVVIMRNPIAGPQVIDGTADVEKPVPINTDEPITVDSPLFHGKIHIHVRGLKSSKHNIFEGKKRYGRFKRDIKASDFWNGHEWFSVTDIVPTRHPIPMVAGFLNPVLASCQLVNVSRPGEEPELWGATEDMRLLHDELTDKNGNPMPSEKRRRWFDVAANAQKVIISKDYVYTWHIWQHWCNISTYRLQLSSLLSFDLCQFSEGQPMQIMAKDQSTGEYSVNLLLWHKRLLYQDDSDHHSLRDVVKDKLQHLKDSWKGMLTSSSKH